MLQIFQHILFLFALFVIFPINTAHAYIDPGTTGSIFTAVAALIPGVAVFFGLLFRPIKKAYFFAISLFIKRKTPNKIISVNDEGQPKT